jgi:pimeloyl-ACP methyl ester carboxylesterase
VADAVDDMRALADAHGWERFGVYGGSGSGPDALACGSLLSDRVVHCVVLSGIKPAQGEQAPRLGLSEIAAGATARIDAGRPEFAYTAGAAGPGGPGRRRSAASHLCRRDGTADRSSYALVADGHEHASAGRYA